MENCTTAHIAHLVINILIKLQLNRHLTLSPPETIANNQMAIKLIYFEFALAVSVDAI